MGAFAPAVNAFDTLLFQPHHNKRAHIRDAVDLKRTMITVIIALLPALVYGIYNTGYQHLPTGYRIYFRPLSTVHGKLFNDSFFPVVD